jgi:hypothetical protein
MEGTLGPYPLDVWTAVRVTVSTLSKHTVPRQASLARLRQMWQGRARV